MFVTNLNEKQQSILLELATNLIAADGIVDSKEQLMLSTLQAQCHPNVKPESASQTKLIDVFDSTAAKSSLLLELIGLAHADDQYHETEKNFIYEVASTFNIDNSTLEDMETWVNRQMLLVKEAQYFMTEE